MNPFCFIRITDRHVFILILFDAKDKNICCFKTYLNVEKFKKEAENNSYGFVHDTEKAFTIIIFRKPVPF